MPNKYLVAIELDELSANAVLEKANALCDPADHCDLIHVIDPTTIAYAIDPTFSGKFARDFEDNAIQKVHTRMLELISNYNLPNCTCHVRVGHVAREVSALLASDAYSVLMIGSHGRRGWQRLLGTHAASIISRSPVDTWVFNVPELPSPPT